MTYEEATVALAAGEISVDDPELNPQSSLWHARLVEDSEAEIAASLFDFVPKPSKPPPRGQMWLDLYHAPWKFEHTKLTTIAWPVPPEPPPRRPRKPKLPPSEQVFPFQPKFRDEYPERYTVSQENFPRINDRPCQRCGDWWVWSDLHKYFTRMRFALRPRRVFEQVVAGLRRAGYHKTAVGIYQRISPGRSFTVRTLQAPAFYDCFWIEYTRD